MRIPIVSHAPDVRIPVYRHKPSASDSFELSGAAFSFTASGEGEYTVSDGTGVRHGSFNGQKTEVREFIGAHAAVTFEGELSYTVFDLAVFSDVFGTDELDIPIAHDCEEYSIRDLAPDFVGPLGAPYADGARIPTSLRISSDKLIVPCGFEGEIYIPYARAPKEIDLDTLNDEIDIPPECEHILALLTASYLWLDDDSEKAQYYMTLYRYGMDDIRTRKSRRTGGVFEDVLGWA